MSKTDISHLQPITHFALAFISMSAGAELYLPELRALFRRIITITTAVTVICFLVCLFVVFGLAKGGLIPFMDTMGSGCQFSVSLIAASIMVTQSPASAIAVVAETKSKGPFTSTMLGITVLTDIVVLLLYSLCAAVANANCSEEAGGFKIADLAVTLGCVCSAIILGYLFGKLIIFLLWLPRVHGEWAVLPLGWAIFHAAAWFVEYSTEEYGIGINFDALLICIVAGYVVANHSRNRRRFLRFMGSCGPLVFIPFFTLTGCGLNLRVMGESAPFAFIMFAVRALTFLGGSALGGYYSGMEKLHLQTLWVSMLTQAGVSLGIAAEVAIAFKAWGTEFQSTIVSVVLINQVVGPVLCKWALRKNGEEGMAVGGEEEEDEERHKRAIIVGINISSLAVAQRLLKHDWNVLFIDTDTRKTDMLQWLQYEKRAKPHRSAAEMKKRRAMQKAREEERARKSFTDLGAGGPPEPSGVASAEASVSREEGQYAPVDDEPELQVDVDSAAAAASSPAAGAGAAASSSSSSASGSLAVPSAAAGAGGDDLNQTTTLPEEQQVQFRLLEAADFVDPKDPVYRLKSAAQCAGLKAATWDCNERNVDAALVMLEADQLNFDLCTVLQDSMHVRRVIAEIQNPNWTSVFASVGVLTVFPYSLASHTLAQMVLCGPHQHLELVPPTRPLHVSLSHVIKPDTLLENPPLYLRHLEPADQQAFLAQHPDPPMPRDQMWKFDEKVKVVSAAQRDEYLAQIQSLHGNNSIKLNHGKAAAAAASAFSGPGMLNTTGGRGGGDGDDADDEEERQFRELRQSQREAARAKKESDAEAKEYAQDV